MFIKLFANTLANSSPNIHPPITSSLVSTSSTGAARMRVSRGDPFHFILKLSQC